MITSEDTFAIQVDRSTLVSPLPISWQVTYTGGAAALTAVLDPGDLRLERGDADGDGDVDLADFAVLQASFSGPSSPPGGLSPQVQSVDFDGDDDVDLEDFVQFLTAFTGPG